MLTLVYPVTNDNDIGKVLNQISFIFQFICIPFKSKIFTNGYMEKQTVE